MRKHIDTVIALSKNECAIVECMECSYKECTRPRAPRGYLGYCSTHSSRHNKKRPMDDSHYTPRVKGGNPCTVPGCSEVGTIQGMCVTHYHRNWKFGDPKADVPLQRKPDKDGWIVDSHSGYVVKRFRTPEGKHVKILQHRAILEEELGRKLLPHENVHHKNGNRADNRRENLELWSTSQPSGQRVEDKISWAKELLSLYEPDSLK